MKFIDENKLLSANSDGRIYKYTDENIGIRVGVEKQISNNLLKSMIYPNPVSNELQIKFSDSEEIALNYSYEIIDINGQRIMKGETVDTNNLIINVSELVSGTYLLKVNEHFTKFVKE